MITEDPNIGVHGRARTPSVHRVSPQELLTAYPEEDPSTAGFAGRTAGGDVDAEDRTASAVPVPLAAAPEDQTDAVPISPGQVLTHPYRSIGRIESRHPGHTEWDHAGAKHGSGALVGPWHVLTASHVVSGDPPGTEYRFLPAYWMGANTSTGVTHTEATIVALVGIHTETTSGFDYMVCQLDRSLGWDWGWLGVDSSTDDGYYTNLLHGSVGYPGNLSNGRRPYRNNVQITDVEGDNHHGRQLKGQSDVAGGWSGGPLLKANLSGYHDPVVGVLSGAADGDDGVGWEDVVFAGGPEMVRLVRYARDNWYSWTNQPENLNAGFGYTRPKKGTGVSACSWGPGRIDLFWYGDDDHLRHTWYADGWQWETDLTAKLGLTAVASDPTVCSWEPGRLDVIWRSADNHLRHLWYATDTDWGWETDLTATHGLTPGWEAAVTSWEPGRLDLFWRSDDKHLRHIWYTREDDWGWETDLTAKLGLSAISSAPSVTSWAPGRLDIVWRSVGDNHLRHLWYTRDDDWGWETDLTVDKGYGPVSRNPAICAWQSDRLDLVWRRSDNRLEHTWYDGDWGWVSDLSSIVSSISQVSPALCSWEPGRLDVFWVDDGAIRHTAYGRS